MLQEKQVLLIDTQKSRGFARADTLITNRARTPASTYIYIARLSHHAENGHTTRETRKLHYDLLCESINLSLRCGERTSRLARTDPLDRVFYTMSGCLCDSRRSFSHKPLDLATMRINKMKSAHDAPAPVSCLQHSAAY